jgi:tRNA(Met) cytidine acetyltransferase
VTSLAALVGDLRAEARRTNERRLLVCHGPREACYERAREVLATIEVEDKDATLVGDRDFLPVERISPRETGVLLGTTTTAAFLDAHDTVRPNALGRVVGAVDGGGLVVLLAPPLDEWPDRHDEFDASLAVSPYDVENVSGAFRARLVALLRTHPGIGIVDADSRAVERDGLQHPVPRLPDGERIDRPAGGRTSSEPSRSGDDATTSRGTLARGERSERSDRGNRGNRSHRSGRGDRGREIFPTAVYERCLTADQARCVRTFERLRESRTTVVAEADRGRGKSSAAGLAAGALAADGEDVLVTAPSYRASTEIFARAAAVFDDLGVSITRDEEVNPRVLDAGEGSVRFVPPTAAADLVGGRSESAAVERSGGVGSDRIETEAGPDGGTGDDRSPDVLFVDEAAGLPVPVLDRLLGADRLAFVTTVHGYEGAGRGFSIRFRERLAASDHEAVDTRLDDPIRYAAGDPVEVWLFRALLLDARPAIDSLVADAAPEAVAYERLTTGDLLADERLLREVFGLLVAAHYRTEPNDLARLLDGPNLSVRALTYRGHVVAVCLLAREGGLPEERRRAIYEGGRIAGHMLPDVLTSQLCDERGGAPAGLRVVRIATHAAVRSRGLGSHLLDRVRAELNDRATADDRENGDRDDSRGVGEHDDGDGRTDTDLPGGIDWLGVGYGATPQLIDFWRENGFHTVHVSTTRNETSGEFSLLMLAGLTDRGEALTRRHTRWFARRFPAVLSDALSALDPDIARGALASAGVVVEPDLSAHEWRVVCKAAYGSGLYDTDPAPFRRLALACFTDPAAVDPDFDSESSEGLSIREERLLVCRVFQARSPEAISEGLDYESKRQCLRALGDAYAVLADRYGGELARAERERWE